MMTIAIMIFGAMCILIGLVIGGLMVWEYAKEWRWLNYYLKKRK